MDIKEFWELVATNGAIQLLLTMVLKARLEASVKHQYDLKLEALRVEMRRREQAAMIAELLSEWTSPAADKTRLTRLSFEASLWLPEATTKELVRTLTNQPGAKTPKELLAEVRKILWNKSDSVGPGDFVHF